MQSGDVIVSYVVNAQADKTDPTQELTPQERRKEEARLKMVFRLCDANRDGVINKDELSGVLKSLDKKPTKKKIDKVLAACSGKENADSITMQQFVDYMMNKLYAKAAPPGKRTFIITIINTIAIGSNTTNSSNTITTITIDHHYRVIITSSPLAMMIITTASLFTIITIDHCRRHHDHHPNSSAIIITTYHRNRYHQLHRHHHLT